jgi:hypothetical protein
MNIRVAVCALAAFVGAGVSPSLAQDSKSAALVQQLTAALEAAKLDSIAAKDPAAADKFFGALYIKGLQLIVVDGQYSVPLALETRIYRKEYKDTYLDLTSTSAPATRLTIEDMGADGLKAKRVPNQAFDTIDLGGKRTMFDSNWRGQKIKEEDYMKAYSDADARYVQILTALLAETKRGS